VIAYKLFRQRKDGSLGALFINRKEKIEPNNWYLAENHPTKGFAERMGWHCTLKPEAPHIKKEPKSGEKRVWCKVAIDGWIEPFERPDIQGGTWLLAEKLKVLEVIG
jgi:hypothetical protein